MAKRANTPALNAARKEQRIRDAAPELYAALKAMLDRGTGDDEYLAAESQARAALAKAETR